MSSQCRLRLPGALSVLLLTLLWALPAAAQDNTGRFRNPVTPAQHASANILLGEEAETGTPDPWLIYHQGYYYMSYTVPVMSLRKSATLAGLADAEPQIVWPREGDAVPVDGLPSPADENPWAPEFHRFRSPEDGAWHWYWYYSPGPSQAKWMAVLESAGDDPAGPYQFKARLNPYTTALDVTEGSTLDGTVFVNDDGRMYYLFSGVRGSPTEFFRYQQLWIAEMENPWTLKTDAISIAAATYPWELIVPINEGPEALLHDGKLHIIYSANQCISDEYKLGRLTVPADADLLDPMTWLLAKHPEPVFDKSIEHSIYSPGHNGFFKSPDGSEDWIVFHAHTTPAGAATGGGCLGVRTAHAQRFTWDADGNPVFGVPAAFTEDLPVPAGDGDHVQQFEDAPIVDFSADRHSIVSGDLNQVGFAALSFAAENVGESITVRMNAPAGTRRLKLRVSAGPDSGLLALAIAPLNGGTYTALGTQSAYQETPGIRVLDFGSADLPGGELLVRLSAAGTGEGGGLGFVADQLRFEPSTVAASAPTAPPPVPAPTASAGTDSGGALGPALLLGLLLAAARRRRACHLSRR